MPYWVRANVWPLVTIAALVLINGVLIVFLVLRSQPPSTAEPEGPSSAQASPATAQPSGVGASDQGPVPTQRLLVITSELTAWRATVGDCDEPGTIERSDDGGTTWQLAKVPELSPVTELETVGSDSLFAIGGDSECKARYLVTDAEGDSWKADNDALNSSWYRIPRDRTKIRVPGGRPSKPCTAGVGDLAEADEDNIMILCLDGKLRLTRNAGRSWKGAGELAGGQAIGADRNGFVTASLTPGCNGVTVTPFVFKGQSLRRGDRQCAPTERAQSGEVALDKEGDSVWVWSGDQVVVSTDNGTSW